jgi:hypothetical protein
MGHLQKPQHQQKVSSEPNLSMSTQKVPSHTAQSGLVQRYYLNPLKRGLAVSGGNHGLGDIQSSDLAALE